MIDQAEVRRIARRLGVDPLVADHDYILGCFLHFLGHKDGVKNSWVFKAGTVLAKCYFPQYRFSEDLDFTVTSPITGDLLIEIIDAASVTMQETTAIRTDFEKIIVDVIQDDHGRESHEG